MARTTFSGPIRTGKESGIPTTQTLGVVLVEQRATVAVGAMKKQIQVPANCFPTNMITVVSQAVSGIAAGVNIRVGTSANVNAYCTIPTSAAGVVQLANVSAANWLAGFGTGESNVIAFDATAQASAADLTQFSAVCILTYRQDS